MSSQSLIAFTENKLVTNQIKKHTFQCANKSWIKQVIYNHKEQQANSQNESLPQQKQSSYSFFLSSQELNANQPLEVQKVPFQRQNFIKNQNICKNNQQLIQMNQICCKVQNLVKKSKVQIESQIRFINEKKLRQIEIQQINKQNYDLIQKYNEDIDKQVQFIFKNTLLNPNNHRKQISFAKLSRQFLEDYPYQNQQNFQLDQNCNYTKNLNFKQLKLLNCQNQSEKRRKTFYLLQQNDEVDFLKKAELTQKKANYAQKRSNNSESTRTKKASKRKKGQIVQKNDFNKDNSSYGKVYKQILALYSTSKMISMSKNK